MIKKLFIIPLLIPILAYSQNTTVVDTLTIEKVVEVVLQNNYSIKIARGYEQLTSNDYSYRNYAFLPSINATASKTYNLNNSNLVFFPDSLGNIRTVEREGAKSDNLNANVALNWTIFDGLGMFINYNRLSEIRAAGLENLRVNIENTVASVSSAYYNIIQQQEKVSAFEDALKISEQRLELAKAQYEVGSGSKLNYLAAQVDYNTDKAALILQQQLLGNSKVDLNELLGREAVMQFTVSDTIIVDENLNISNLKESALQRNPNLLLAQRNKNSTYLATKVLKAQRLPTINATLGYGLSQVNQQVGNFTFSKNVGLNYGLTARLPILNGFNQSRLIQSSKINEEIAENQIQDVTVQLEAGLERAYINYQNSLTLIALEKDNLSIARQNIDIALERYKLGVSTPLELREVQRNAVATESRLIEAEYAGKLAEIELLRLSSQIIQ